MHPELHNSIATHDGWQDWIGQVNPMVEVTKFQKNTILHVAAIYGNTQCAEQILISHPSLVQARNAKGDTALHITARLGNRVMLDALTERFRAGDENRLQNLLRLKNNEDNTVLHEAVLSNNHDVVEYLIGKDPFLTRCENGKSESALFLAVDRQFDRIAGHIMSTENYSVKGRNGMNAVQAATIRSKECNIWQRVQKSVGHIIFFFIPQRLMKLANDIIEKRTNYRRILCCSAGMLLCIMTSLDIIGAIVLLFFAIIECTTVIRRILGLSEGNLTLIRSLLENCGAEILKQQDDFGWTPLHYVAHFSEVNLLNQFLQPDNWPIAYLRDKEGMSALHISARDGQVKVVSILIERCPDLCESTDNRSRTALHVAVESRKKNVVEVLVRKKAFNHLLNERDIEGNTALHLAAAYGHYGIVELLTSDKRVDKGALNNMGMTALGAILSNTQLTSYSKALIIMMLQMRGVQPSLERGVLRKIKIAKKIHATKGFRGILEVPPSSTDNDQAAGPSGSSSSTASKDDENKLNKSSRVDQIKSMAQVNLVVATIICSLTFNAAITMPGGYGASDGMASLRRKDEFRIFLLFDSMAFGLAASSMLLHFIIGFMSMVEADMYKKYPFDGVAWLTILSIASTVVAFYFGTNAVLWQDFSNSTFPGLITAICFIVPLLYFFICEGLRMILKFYFPAIYMK